MGQAQTTAMCGPLADSPNLSHLGRWCARADNSGVGLGNTSKLGSLGLPWGA